MLKKVKENLLTIVGVVIFAFALFWPTPQDDEQIKDDEIISENSVSVRSPESNAYLKSLSEKSFEQVIKEREPAIAFILGRSFSGTGFMVNEDIVVTNKHVIESEFENDISIQFPSAGNKTLSKQNSTKILYVSRDHDLAFLRAKKGIQPIPIDSNYSFRRGQEIVVIGNPGAGGNIRLENAISKGIMSSELKIDLHAYFQLGIAINPGNSGGPVLDNRGACIGVATLKATKQESIAFCIPPDILQAELDRCLSLSKREMNFYSSQHRMKVCYKKMQDGLLLQGAVLQTYVDVINDCVQKRQDIQRGLDFAKILVVKKVQDIEEEVMLGVRDEISKISSDPNVDTNIRIKFADYWTNYQEMKFLIENPRASEDYGNKFIEINKKHKRLTDSIGMLIGI